ncbi:GIY-YIG nuclease family protein [Anabaena sp. UHCC 0451]|uniref:GIY-YIG nuclease family protein n=1 Tax=Anabaena sp. UHCC 0451 TaxID=2055235 RepID=UPI002B20015D|nr:GIY-YIG nuclease family protein [Anabaena sp. UHCC 0451]MEA5578709.1 GIY-YIG nuclease family protein [Anabaena sp. UHCC 0451]
MKNPTEINLASLPWLPLAAKTAFPKNPAIYFAIDSTDTIQYIGRSVNPRARWQNHHKYE